MAKYYRSRGWDVIEDWHMRDGHQIDVYGVQGNGLSRKGYLLVECKDKPRVTKVDVTSFSAKAKAFWDAQENVVPFGGAPNVYAVVAHTGEVSEELRGWSAMLTPPIIFRRF